MVTSQTFDDVIGLTSHSELLGVVILYGWKDRLDELQEDQQVHVNLEKSGVNLSFSSAN